MRYRKHNVVVAGRKKLRCKVFYPLFLFQATGVRTVPVTTAMILLMQVVTLGVVTPVMMHAPRSGMAFVQLLKNMLTVRVVPV